MIQPRDITNEIKKRPPLQREVAEKSYQGIKVNWKLEFWNARGSLGDNTRLMIDTTPENDLYPDVLFEVDKDEYPNLNILNQHDCLWVDGEISKVEGLHINLKNVSIRFSETKEEMGQNSFGRSLVVNNSQLHFGNGDNIAKEKNLTLVQPRKKWYEKPTGQIFIDLCILLVGGGILFWLGWN